ncbi:hypothetical protein [Neorhizobium sp. S3-V5DH]|uniref:hypothetical protein n=1 Tax=Neorhizobium sp. S3-V5DH TaxID=2485166 RepID=UPI001046EC99|nr:hypothetical protein [Neorhizobium sp. S3-V5DH]TCV67263.1 hypothetical protein EDE09_114119 [Neorhizobium sp. S3-V5DH]
MSFLSNANTWLSNLSDSAVRDIATRINEDGIFWLPDFLATDDLQKMREFVAEAIARGGHQSVSLRSDELDGSGLDELAGSKPFRDLFSRLYLVGTGQPAPVVKFHQILRCLTGESVAKHSLMFHYDSYILTALIPVEIPATGKRGDFLIIPNTRQIRSNYVFNLADKVVLDNALVQRVLRARASNGKVKRVSMQPGALYLFWGYRSIHTNEPVDEGAVRATALYHYADPHADSFVKRQLGRR